MTQLLRICLIGLAISFLGSLPLGTMNVTATHIAIMFGFRAALIFSFAAVLIEMSYVRLALVGMDWVYKHYQIFRIFEWLTVLLLFALATGSCLAAIHKSGIGSALPIPPGHPFLLGTILSATNPLHLIFWFGWSSILADKQILLATSSNYNYYVAGIGIGSILGYGVFIVGGPYLIHLLKANQVIFNWVIGGVLLLTAFIQLYRILSKPSVLIFRNRKVR
jgi:threonine/homoserine/homoserine lactone efflux protein